MATLDDKIINEINKYEELLNNLDRIKENSPYLTNLQNQFEELQKTLRNTNNEIKSLEALKRSNGRLSASDEARYNDLLNKQIQQKKDSYELSKKISIADKTISDEYEKQAKYLKEGYTWADKISERFKDNGGEIFLRNITGIKNGFSTIYNTVKNVLEPWGKASQAASDYAKKIGLSGKSAERLRKETIEFVNAQAISAKYNKSIDELIKLQGAYTSKVGRSISMTNKQRESLIAMSSVVGDDMAIELTSKLENFGLSATEAGNRVSKIFNESSKKGIVFEQYSKNFVDNIKLAQTYTFKDGLRGLANMAEKATAIKLNMSQASAFADKVSTVEGAITTGAQLQVLGGPFAQYSNPMSLLYEGLNDLEGLQDRIISIFGNIGKWNSSSGEVEISAFNKMRMKQFAQVSGMDYSNLMESVQATARQKEIQNRYSSQLYGLNSNQIDFIKNTATYDAEKGEFGLSDAKGNFVSINELVSNKEKLQEVIDINKSETDDIKDIAVILRGWDDSISGLKKQTDAAKALIAERTKIGPFIQNTIQKIGQDTTLITSLLGTYLGFKIGKGLFQIGNGVGRTFNSGRNIWRNRREIFNTPTAYPSNNVPQIGPYGGGMRYNRNGQPIWGGRYGGRRIPRDLAESYRRNYDDLMRNGGNVTRRGLNRTLTRGKIKIGRVLSNAGGVAKIGSIAGLAGMGTGILNDYLSNSGIIKKGGGLNKTLNVGSNALSGAGWGASIGSMVLPFAAPIGAAVGATIGTAIGAYTGHRKNVKNAQISSIYDQGFTLQGEYNVKTLKRINEVLQNNDISKLREKDIKRLQENDEYDLLKTFIESRSKMPTNINQADLNAGTVNLHVGKGSIGFNNEIQFAKGGLLNGPSHSNGGMRILGTNKTVEGGEFIVNKLSTKKYFNTLSRINSDTTSVKPIEPLGKIIKVSAPSSSSLNNNIGSIKVDPININLNGTIKLDTGKQNIDITNEILSNPTLLNNIVDLISKQINVINNNGSFNKKSFKQKWTY